MEIYIKRSMNLTFDSVDEVLECDHSNGSTFFVNHGSNVSVVNPKGLKSNFYETFQDTSPFLSPVKLFVICS